MLPAIPDSAVLLHRRAEDWQDAVRLAAEGLERSGATTDGYAQEMIRMIQEHGPYVVISPGLALAHARPGPEVLRDGLSVVTLEEPVAFGHPYNDPVAVVLGLAVHSPERHLGFIADIANAFNDTDTTAELASADDADAVRAILGATS